MLFLNKIKILNDKQSGFRPGLRIFNTINIYASDLYTALHEKKSIISIYMETFDTIQPKILLDKMCYYGIRGCIHDRLIQLLLMGEL